MKKILSVFLCVLVFTALVACDKQVLPDPQGDAFEAVVMEVREEGFLVMPVEGSDECGAAMEVGLLVLHREGLPTVKVGDRVRIDYDGVITRSLPGRLGEVYSVYIID